MRVKLQPFKNAHGDHTGGDQTAPDDVRLVRDAAGTYADPYQSVIGPARIGSCAGGGGGGVAGWGGQPRDKCMPKAGAGLGSARRTPGGEVAGGRQKPVVRRSVRWGEWTGESCSDSSICGGEALLL